MYAAYLSSGLERNLIMKLLKENIYYIGAINPNLRVFDIIMKTEYGTTYNAYLVKGDKIALVETVHDRFTESFLEDVQAIASLDRIDYIVMNHTEPDHSGSIARLLKINPDITVVGSAAAIKNISNITNMEFKSRVVKTGDVLELGQGMDMQFIISPNLHWPDSMFTYIAGSKTVFTCDFLGAHYCEPLVTDDKVTYPEAYDSAFLNYYTAIFGPFKKFVLDGLAHLEKLDFDMVCNSHGPVLATKAGIQKAMALYKEWSALKPHEKNVAIFYVSAYGYTRSLAETFADELNQRGIPTKSYDIIKHSYDELKEALEEADGILFGSPTINRDALKPVWDLLSCTDAIVNKGKPCMVFGSYGWSGEACKMLEERVKSLGLKLVEESFRVVMKPSDADYEKAREIAASFAKVLS